MFSKIGVLKNLGQTEFLVCKLMLQKKHQHGFKNNCVIYILLPQKRHQHLFKNNYI